MERKVKIYLIMTFVSSWILWGIVAIGGKWQIQWLGFHSITGKILYVLGGVAPAVCELMIQKKTSTQTEWKDILKKIADVRHPVILYVYAIGGAAVIQGMGAVFDHSLMQQPIYMGVLLILPMIIGGGLEEIGWRGMLQPELERRYPHWKATLAVGIIWALWHIPLWFIDGTNQQSMNFLWFCINAIMLSYFIGSVCYISNSIFMPILAHASINAFWEVMPASSRIGLSLCLLVLVAAVTLWIDSLAVKAKKVKKR